MHHVIADLPHPFQKGRKTVPLFKMLPPQFLRWFPALAWTAVIAWFSSATFAASETGGVLEWVLKGLWPTLSAGHLDFLHTLLRKGAHVTAYAILSLCWFQALSPGFKLWQPTLVLRVLLICLSVACWDEYHQSLQPSRTGSIWDVGWDMSGALGLQTLLALWLTGRKKSSAVKVEQLQASDRDESPTTSLPP
jgi:VanZ family protein